MFNFRKNKILKLNKKTIINYVPVQETSFAGMFLIYCTNCLLISFVCEATRRSLRICGLSTYLGDYSEATKFLNE